MIDAREDQKRTVPQTNALIRALIEQETLDHPFWIGGIITRNFISDSGHIYFDLTDENYSISCMVREKIRGTLNFGIKNGIEIEVFGTIRVFEKRAQVQIEVEKARLIERSPYIINSTVQEQLAQKGLWPKEKRNLPAKITTIGLVTSKQSDALHDFEDTFRSEHGTAAIKLSDVRLQGQQAAREIADAINRFNHEARVDVIALVRGGGRDAELSTFNELIIAEAICRSTIPVLTGIGHQRDHTLADEVADISAITPTAAADYLARENQPQTIPIESESKATKRTPYVYVIALLSFILVALVMLLLVVATR